MNFIVCLCCLLIGLSSARKIQASQQKHIQIQLGEQYLEIIQEKFNNFQHSTLKSLKRETPYQEKPICNIRQYKAGLLTAINMIPYNESHSSVKDNKIIYKLSELRSLNIFIDAIKVNHRVIAMFYHHQIIVYKVEQQTGELHRENSFTISSDLAISEGKFVIIQFQLYFMSKERMIKMDLKGEITQISGYIPLSQMFDDIKIWQSNIYIAAGSLGLISYTIDTNRNSLSRYHRFTFQLKNDESQGLFDANQIHIEQEGNSLFLLDYNQGLIHTLLPNVSQIDDNFTHITVKESRALIGGCYNLIVTPFHIYLTCPELIQLNKNSGRFQKSNHNSFNPYRLQFDSKRIYVFGHKQLAVYDIYGRTLSEHSLNMLAQRSILLGIYLVSFSNNQVVSQRIQSQKEALYCYTLDNSKAGIYKGSYTTQGLCREYENKPDTSNQICEVQSPFILTIKERKETSYTIYFLILGGYVLFSGILAFILLIKYHLMQNKYKTLVQEQIDNQGPSSLQLSQKKKREQEEQVQENQ